MMAIPGVRRVGIARSDRRSVARRPAVSWQQAIGSAGLSAFLVVCALSMLGPFLWMVVSSFKQQWEITAAPPIWLPGTWEIGNYLYVITESPLVTGYRNSLIIAPIVTIAQVFTSTVGGYAFAKLRFKGRDALFIGLLSTLMLPGFLIQIPLYVIMSHVGWLNTYQAMIVPFLFTPFGIFLMRQFIMGVPSEYIDSARIDGSGELRIIWSVIFPLTREAAAALAIFVFIGSWNDLFWPLLVLRQREMFTLPVALLALQGDYGTYYHYVLAGATLAIIPVVLVYVVFQERIVRGVVLTGLKG